MIDLWRFIFKEYGQILRTIHLLHYYFAMDQCIYIFCDECYWQEQRTLENVFAWFYIKKKKKPNFVTRLTKFVVSKGNLYLGLNKCWGPIDWYPWDWVIKYWGLLLLNKKKTLPKDEHISNHLFIKAECNFLGYQKKNLLGKLFISFLWKKKCIIN